jgi:hypothetical protein
MQVAYRKQGNDGQIGFPWLFLIELRRKSHTLNILNDIGCGHLICSGFSRQNFKLRRRLNSVRMDLRRREDNNG